MYIKLVCSSDSLEDDIDDVTINAYQGYCTRLYHHVYKWDTYMHVYKSVYAKTVIDANIPGSSLRFKGTHEKATDVYFYTGLKIRLCISN